MILPTDIPMLQEARRLVSVMQYAQAMELYEKLTQKYPQYADLWFDCGNAAVNAGDFAQADQAFVKAIALEPQSSDRLLRIGHIYAEMRLPEKALACLNSAQLADPQAINPRISRAVLMEKQHRLPEARTAVEECLELDPRNEQARFFCALLDQREGKLESAERRLRDLLSGAPAHLIVRQGARYELAQILDQTQRPDEAMRWLDEAKAMVWSQMDVRGYLREYDVLAEERRLIAAMPRDILRSWGRNYPVAQHSAMPPLALLGGHPRSGTTLLEQVLDTHPSIAALDESSAFMRDVIRAFLPPHMRLPYDANRLNALSVGPINSMRQAYLKRFLAEAGKDNSRLLVDKNPELTVMLPLWLRVFPELRVLISLRDPRDVVLSCYFQNMGLTSVSINFLTLERTVRHYADLMDVWLAVRQWEGFAWLETRYEDMVANLEKEGTRVTNFLGIQWNPEQLRYYERGRKKELYAPTYYDVTQPIYHRAVGRWRPYEKYLKPVLPLLDRYVRALGYDSNT